MFRIIKRRKSEKAIRNFLGEYFPKIGLGKFEKIERSPLYSGIYFVTTTKGKYKMYYLVNSLKVNELQIELLENEKEYEYITFKIVGKWRFKIYPNKFSITRDEDRQVTLLINGVSQVYPMEKKARDVDYICIEYRKPIKESNVLNLSRTIEISGVYI